MNSLISIASYLPRQSSSYCVEVRHLPEKEAFASGAEDFIFVYGANKPRRSARKCIISHQTVAVWGMCGGGQGWELKPSSYELGARYLASAANSEVISILKRLGAFEFAEQILDFQSSAFPRFRS